MKTRYRHILKRWKPKSAINQPIEYIAQYINALEMVNGSFSKENIQFPIKNKMVIINPFRMESRSSGRISFFIIKSFR